MGKIIDGCEWHPSGRPALENDKHHRTTRAELILGTSRSVVSWTTETEWPSFARSLLPKALTQTGNWRVCRRCAKDHAFRRLRKRVEIKWH